MPIYWWLGPSYPPPSPPHLTIFLFPFRKKENKIKAHSISSAMKRHSIYNSNYNNGNAKPQRWALPLFLLALVTVLGWRRLRASSPSAAGSGSEGLPALPRLAYMISGSKGDGAHVERLVRAVYHRRNYYLVHLDVEASEEERSWVAAMGLRNVMDVGRPNVVTAKGPSEMAATLHAAAILLKNAPNWDWFVNLGASDYPLVSQHDLLHVLSYLPRDLNFMEHTSNLGGKEEEMGKPIIIDSGLYHMKKSAIFWAKERRSMPASFKLFTGSAGVMVSRALAEMCVVGWDNLPRTLLMYQTNMLRSSESYFHTVACNHKEYQNTTVNHSLRVSPPLSLHNMLRTGAPFATRIHAPHLLDAIDAHLARHPHPHPADTDDVVLPTADSARLQNLLLNLLHPRHFRPNQCN